MTPFLFLIFLTTGLATLLVPTASSSQEQQKQSDRFVLENEQKRAQNPEEITFTLRLKDNKTRFHAGEIIRLELSFSSSAAKTFILDNASYDRSGRLEIDSFVLDRLDGTADPLHDYFKSYLFGFIGGGLRGTLELSEKREVITAELNEWIHFDRPGRYRMYVVSGRVSKKRNQVDRFGVQSSPVVSNIVEFDILPDDEKWANQKLREAITSLDRMDGDQRAACRTLRFLGTTAAASEMIKRFRGDDHNCDFEYRFGLIGSPYRVLVIREMERALSLPEQPVATGFLYTLTLLAFTRQAPTMPPYPEGNNELIKQWQAQLERRRHSYNQVVLDHVQQLAAAIPQKQDKARATSLQTLLDYKASLNNSDLTHLQNLLATLPEVFGRLPLDAQVRLLTHQWKPVASVAMLPILREIFKQSDNNKEQYQQRELRSIVLRRLYELSPKEGRQLIIEEIQRSKPRVDQRVLRLLPDEHLPELDYVLAANLEETRKPNGSGDAEAISDLIERYATAEILGRVRAVYEAPGAGMWACRIQASLLAYILRNDPATGGELLNKALSARSKGLSRCYTSTLSDVAQLHMSAEVEAAANAALEESDPEVVSQAAKVLGEYGSAQAEERLWRRLARWHQEMQGQAEALSKQNPEVPAIGSSVLGGEALIEQALRNALNRGQGWLSDPEKLKRLGAICLTDGCRNELEGMILNWNQEIHFSLTSFEDRPFSIRIAHYELDSLERLKQKLLQFPKGTLFTWRSRVSADHAANEQEIYQQVNSYLEDHGMKLERKTEQ